MRHAFIDPDREKATQIGNIAIYSYEKPGKFIAKAWRGKQSGTYAHFRFKTDELRAEWCREQVADDKARTVEKVEHKKRDALRVAEMRKQIQVGTLLLHSWGYDQTNCDFYEVVERKGASAIVRPIGAETVSTQDYNGMADQRKAAPGKFIGEPFRKLITAYGLSMGHGSAYPITADSEHYCSWYA